MIKLLKNKKGNFVSTIIIFPLWLSIIILMGYIVSNHKTIENLSNTNQVVSRILETSYSYEEANNKINGYFNARKDKDMFKITKANGMTSFIEITSIEKLVVDTENTGSYYQEIASKEDLAKLNELSNINSADLHFFKNRNLITYKITTYTQNYKNKVFEFSIGSYTWNALDTSYTYETTVTIAHKN